MINHDIYCPLTDLMDSCLGKKSCNNPALKLFFYTEIVVLSQGTSE